MKRFFIVHDQDGFLAEELLPWLKGSTEGVMGLQVPILVGVGKNWGKVK